MTNMNIVGICNFKGGVGKTTTSINLASGIQKLGNRVLLIDSDPQGSLSNYCLGDDIGRTLHDVYEGRVAHLSDAVVSLYNGVDLVPSDEMLEHSRINLLQQTKPWKLKQLLEEVSSEYDYVICDAPAAKCVLVLNLILASDYLFSPINPEPICIESMKKFMNRIEEINTDFSVKKQINGLIFTHVNFRRNLTRQMRKEVSDILLSSEIGIDDKLAKAFRSKKSIYDFAGSSKAAEQYMNLSKEVIKICEK